MVCVQQNFQITAVQRVVAHQLHSLQDLTRSAQAVKILLTLLIVVRRGIGDTHNAQLREHAGQTLHVGLHPTPGGFQSLGDQCVVADDATV